MTLELEDAVERLQRQEQEGPAAGEVQAAQAQGEGRRESMRWWLVVLIVLAILLLIGQVRLGGTVCYNTAGLTVSVLIGPFHIRVLPAREKPDKPKKRPGRKKKTGPETEDAAGKKETGRPGDGVPAAGSAAGRQGGGGRPAPENPDSPSGSEGDMGGRTTPRRRPSDLAGPTPYWV